MRLVAAALATLAAALVGSAAQKPATAAPVAAASTFRPIVVGQGFESPVHIVANRSEPARLYVVEQRGTIRVLQRGRIRPGPFLDLRGTVSTEGKEQGLLGLAFDPRYATNRFVYVNYTNTEWDTRVVRYRTNGTKVLPASARLLLKVEQPYWNHNGGNLVFGPNGLLYVGLGDGGGSGDPEDRAQSMSSLLGKMLTLDVRRPARRPVVAAVGLRNPWRYSFDRATGDLYIGDVGWRTREEIDYLPRRSQGVENFGWDVFEGSVRLSDKSLGPGRLVGPIHDYDHDAGCSVTGGFVYRGKARSEERGRYFFGDYCEGTVWSLRVRDGRAADLRTEPFRVQRLTTFGEDVAGELYAASQSGEIYRLSG